MSGVSGCRRFGVAVVVVAALFLIQVAVASAVPPLQLPFASGASWWANGPHSSDGVNGARNSVDLGPGGPAGAIARAAASGTAHVGTCSGGYYVRIDHADGWATRYWHLASVPAGLDGASVSAGDVVGTTGIVCGNPTNFSHVHFSLLKDGQPWPLDGVSIGGYTIHASAAQYDGWWTRDSDGATVHTTSGGSAACCVVNNQAAVSGGALTAIARLSVSAQGGFKVYQPLTFSYTVRNTSGVGASIKDFRVAVRGPGGQGLDTLCQSGKDVGLVANQEWTCTAPAATGFSFPGTYTMWADWLDYGDRWHTDELGAAQQFTLTASDQALALIVPLGVSAPQGLFTNRSLTFTFTALNVSGVGASIRDLRIPVRGPSGQGLDAYCSAGANVSLAGGQTFVCTSSIPGGYSWPGTYTYWADWLDFGDRWHTGELGPPSTFTLAEPLILTRTSALSVQAPGGFRVYQPIAFSYSVQNTAGVGASIKDIRVIVRGPSGDPLDYHCDNWWNLRLEAWESWTCTTSATTGFGSPGTYTIWADWLDYGDRWHTGELGPTQTFTLAASDQALAAASSLDVSAPNGFYSHHPLRLVFAAFNRSGVGASIKEFRVPVRGPQGQGLDLVCNGGIGVTLAAGQEFSCVADALAGFAWPGRYTYWPDWLDFGDRWHTDELGPPRTFDLAADTALPVIGGVPQPITATVAGQGGVAVSWPSPTATDALDGHRPVACSPISGSTFAVGRHTVTCTAADLSGNTASATFDVAVVDVGLPVISGVPGHLRQAAASAGGRVVSWPSPAAVDAVDGARPVVCAPAAGSLFPLGRTVVTCSAMDLAGNRAEATFQVIVTAAWVNERAPMVSGLNDVSLSWGSLVANQAFACQLDGGSSAACSSPRVYHGLTAGPHAFCVRATIDVVADCVSWTIADPGAPTTRIIGISKAGRDVSVSFSVDQQGVSSQCRLDGGAWRSCASGFTWHGLPLGSHSVQVRSTSWTGVVEGSPATGGITL